MSRLEELIAELCPNGVAYIPMGSFMTRVKEKGKKAPEVSQVYVVSNTQGIVKAEDYRDNSVHSEDTSNYTIIRPGMIAYNPSRLNIGSIAMLNSDVPGLVSPMYVVFEINEDVVLKPYFEYLMKSSFVASKINSFKEEGARFRFDFSRWNWIKVQIPPLEVQREIVRILERFTSYSADLSVELSARRKQYEYYRNEMLTFDKSIPKISLNDITNGISSGKNKERLDDGEYPVYGSTGIISQTNTPVYDWQQILVARVGANAGFVHLADGQYDVSDNTLIVDVKEGHSLKYEFE